jgi:hypothetical protein
MSTTNDFQTDWGFPADVRDSIDGAIYYNIRQTSENFRSGRPKCVCCFTAKDNSVIERRDAMELISKRTGKPYHVVRRHAAPSPASQATRDQLARNATREQQWSIDDVGLP